jgi:hypothetical protein
MDWECAPVAMGAELNDSRYQTGKKGEPEIHRQKQHLFHFACPHIHMYTSNAARFLPVLPLGKSHQTV